MHSSWRADMVGNSGSGPDFLLPVFAPTVPMIRPCYRPVLQVFSLFSPSSPLEPTMCCAGPQHHPSCSGQARWKTARTDPAGLTQNIQPPPLPQSPPVSSSQIILRKIFKHFSLFMDFLSIVRKKGDSIKFTKNSTVLFNNPRHG